MPTVKLRPFQTARLKLTLWYILISALLLFVCSLAAIKAERQAFDKFEKALGNPVTRPHLTELLQRQIGAFESNFTTRLFIFDILLLIVASGASYFLSGRTLKPIQEMIQKQEEFAADASHELRTPLTTINIEIEALTRTEKNIPKTVKNAFESIQEEVNKMTNLVDGLLTLVRTSSSVDNKQKNIFDLHELAYACITEVKPLAEKKQIQLIEKQVTKVSAFADKEKIKQVIIILLENATKYTRSNGTITLKTWQEKANAHVTISDTGIGIAESDLPHIFERFYRGENQQAAKEKGSGLGLAIAKKIIEANQGIIRVQSELNKGSSFEIILPEHS